MPIDPAVQAMAEGMAEAGLRPFSDFDPTGARAQLAEMQAGMNASMSGDEPVLRAVEDITIPGPDGPLAARWYRALGDRAGIVVYLHGGGWVLGTLDDYDRPLKALANMAGCDVLSVDYRLAPEHRFPAPLDDALAAVRWAGDQAAGAPIAVAGDSAGGNLAAVAVRRIRDEGGPQIALQLLAYPVSDCDFTTGSYEQWKDAPILPARDMHWYWGHYVPNPADRAHPDASPLRATDLSGLPPALVIVAECDPLHDEVVAYAGRLKDAGNEVELHEGPGMPHGFFTFNGVLPQADEALALGAARLRERLSAKAPE
jgi:acetyl esterase